MLSLTFLFTSLLVSFAAAQSNTTFDPSSVDLTTRNNWCSAEQHNCPTLCGGQAHLKTQTCDGNSLNYSCICSNNSQPANIKDYVGTIPNFICLQTFADCRIANPGSQACATCGTLQPSDVQALPSSSSSAAASSTPASSTGTATGASTSATSKSKSGAGKIEAAGGVIGAAIGLAALML